MTINTQFVTLFQDFLFDIVSEETQSVSILLIFSTLILTILQVAYTDCSTTSGVLSQDPLVLRFNNKTTGFIYGNSGSYAVTRTQLHLDECFRRTLQLRCFSSFQLQYIPRLAVGSLWPTFDDIELILVV